MRFKSYRFWVYWHGSPVKLKLTAENTETRAISFRHAEKCDEGWSSETEVYWLETEFDARRGSKSYVHGVRFTDGRDCDGHFQTESHWLCPTHRLQSRHPDPEFTELRGILLPEWKDAGHKQRDYSAEAMNY